MTFDNTLPHALPWNYPWIKDEIERRDEYIAQLEAELAHQRPQNDAHGSIEGEGVKVPAEDETEAHSEIDSRERILADLEKLTHKWHDYDGNFMRIYGGVAYAQVKELLDRQAAITERNFRELEDDLTADNLWMHERITELQQRVDELTAERDELTQQVDTLRNQRNAMARKLRQAENDRDRYRAALGKAIDCADEIRRLS